MRSFWAAFAILAVAASATILVLGAPLTFQSDEWEFLATRSFTDPATLFAPYNRHWVTVPTIVHVALRDLFGTTSYLPFMVVLTAVHVGVAAVVTAVVRRVVSPRVALAAGAVVLWLGSGFGNLFWAFQIGMDGAVLTGLAGLGLAARGQRPWASAALMTVAIASHAIGAAFLGAAIIGTVARLVGLRVGQDGADAPVAPVARVAPARFLAILGIPVGLGLVWLVGVGLAGMGLLAGLGPNGGAVDAGVAGAIGRNVGAIPEFVVVGGFASVGSMLGLGTVGGVVVALGLVAAAAFRFRRSAAGPAAPVLCVAAAAALVLEFILVALIRGGDPTDQETANRFLYVGAIVALVSVAAWFGQAIPEPSFGPDRSGGAAAAARGRASLLMAGIVVTAVLGNAVALARGWELVVRSSWEVRVVIEIAHGPFTTLNPLRLGTVRDAASVRAVVARHGWPGTTYLPGWPVVGRGEPPPGIVLETCEWVVGPPAGDLSDVAACVDDVGRRISPS